MRPYTKSLHDRFFPIRGNFDPQAGRRKEGVLRDPVGRNGRRYACQAVINGCAELIDIGPGSLPSSLLILLYGRVSVPERQGQSVFDREGISGTAKVKKAYPFIPGKQDGCGSRVRSFLSITFL